jgi:hypothetical protein
MTKRRDELEEDSLEVFRHTPTGTNDPNIVGDVGPFDIPPGSDRRDPGEFDDVRGAPLVGEIDEIDLTEDEASEYDYE